APARVPPLTIEQLDGAARDALRGAFPAEVAERFFAGDDTTMRLPNALATMVRNPTVAGPFLAYNSVLLGKASIAPRLRELVVLRVAWRTHADYEWAQHV